MAVPESQIVSSPSFVPLENPELTTKQNLFVHYYLETKNGTKAAELAGYLGDKSSLGAIASENLRKPLIRSAIETYYKSRLLSADGVLGELSDIASAPWRDSVEVKYGDNGEVISAQLRLTDKIKSLELVGKFHRLFADKVETEVNLSDESVNKLGEALIANLLLAAQQRQQAIESQGVIDIKVETPACGVPRAEMKFY